MSPSNDSILYGYDHFHRKFLEFPCHRALVPHARMALPDPAHFSIQDPSQIYRLAYYGHIVMPMDERAIKEQIVANGPLTHTVSDRIGYFEEEVQAFNARVAKPSLRIEMMELNAKKRLDLGRFNGTGIDVEWIKSRHAQHVQDVNYMAAGHNARLDFYAREMGFKMYAQMKAFLVEIDAYAATVACVPYAILCTPTRYLNQMVEFFARNADISLALAMMKEDFPLLQKESPFIIDTFIKCRVKPEVPYLVQVSDEGVHIDVRKEQFRIKGVVQSQYQGDIAIDIARQRQENRPSA